MANRHVVLHPPQTMRWAFDGGHPYYATKGGEYLGHEHVDPCPAYAHDMNLVDEHLKHVSGLAPMNMDVTVNVISHEGVGRTNGFATHGKYWDAGDVGKEARARGVEHYGVIVLSAKRIPPMPAMTKYLVAHEYGHLVEGWLERDLKTGDAKIRKMYAELREAKEPDSYGPGSWHKGIGELFANDFRILVCRTEVGFWPHAEIARPETLPAVQRFWQITQKQLLAESQALAAA